MTIKGFIRCWPQSLVTESIPGALDHRADLHAVGVVLYGALCGPGPFDGLKEPGEVFLAHRRDAALPWPWRNNKASASVAGQGS